MVLYNIRLMLCTIHDITEEVHLKKELEFSAAHDPLTGLLNRREFHRLPLRRQLYPRGYCLLLIDIDHFPRALMIFTAIKKGDVRSCWCLSTLETSVDREDENLPLGWRRVSAFFCPISPIGLRADTGGGIRQAVSEYQTLSVTVSIGVAEHHDGGNGRSTVFPASIKRVYAAKNDGRNRVTRMPLTALSDGAVEMAPPE